MRIQHNIMAMNAYRNYNINTKALSGNLEKLSSGYKINRAGDDAAGLAISEKMRAQITGLDAAQKNVKDGISLVKTAEGAMQEIQDMLNRMDYLATQSANGTYQDAVDREALQDEVDALREEINRIADSANFNGIKLLNGNLDGDIAAAEKDKAEADAVRSVNVTAVHDHVEAAETKKMKFTLDLSGLKVTSSSTGSETVDISFAGGAITFQGQATSATAFEGSSLSGPSVGDTYTVGGVEFAVTAADNGIFTFEMSEDPTDGSSFTGFGGDLTVTTDSSTKNWGQNITAHIDQEQVIGGMTEMAQGTFGLSADMVKDGSKLTIGNQTYVFAVGKDSTTTAAGTNETLVDLKDLTPGDAGLSEADLNTAAARLSGAANGKGDFIVTNDAASKTLKLTERTTAKDGDKYGDYELIGNDATTPDAAWKNVVSYVTKEAVEAAGNSVSTPGKLTLQIGDDSEDYNRLDVSVKSMKCDSLGIDQLSIKTADDAADAIQTIKDAINTVSATRGKLGAIQNRLEHTGNNLSVMAENIQDAESTIRDTDVANEMMAYVKNNILVQSAQAMLAQANQVPQGVLQLLG